MCGLVILRNAIIDLPEHRYAKAHDQLCSQQKIYSIFSNAITLKKEKKQTYLKQLKDVYKISRG